MGFNKSIIIGVLLVSLCSIALVTILLDVSDNYGVTVPDEYQEVFDEYSASKALVEDMNVVIEGGDVNPDGQDQAVYKNVVVAGKISRQSSGLATDMLNQTPKLFGIDVTIIGILITLIILLVLFGFIAMISRRNP